MKVEIDGNRVRELGEHLWRGIRAWSGTRGPVRPAEISLACDYVRARAQLASSQQDADDHPLEPTAIELRRLA